MTCGIYKISNIVTGDFYIGSSKNIEERWKNHKRDLKFNRHDNIILQNSYNKYYQNNFEWTILEKEISIENLLLTEQNYLDNLNPKFNIIKIAGKPPTPDLRKKINQYSLSGKFLKTWDSIKEAAIYYGSTDGSIIEALRRRNKSGNGYQWKYFENDIQDISPMKPKPPYKKWYPFKVGKYDVNGTCLETYRCISEACVKNKTKNVGRAIKQNTTACGFYWKWLPE